MPLPEKNPEWIIPVELITTPFSWKTVAFLAKQLQSIHILKDREEENNR